MLGLSEGKFIGGRDGNSFEIGGGMPWPIAVNQCRREGKAWRGEDLRVFIGKCATGYA